MAEKKSAVSLNVKNVGMQFMLNSERGNTLKQYMINKLKGKKMEPDVFWGIRNITFQLREGDRLGILGLNGAGKSTLLKVIAGVYKPTEGTVRKKGVTAPLLELGAGFDKQYTARENIYLYGAVLGYDKAYIDSIFDEVISFAELEKFVDVPIMNYSSGMRSRLGFSICTAVHPDILILDEVLSVGDAKFRKKSEKRVKKLMNDHTTVLFVSHNTEQVRRICNKAMILDHGTMLQFGEVNEVADAYISMTEGE